MKKKRLDRLLNELNGEEREREEKPAMFIREKNWAAKSPLNKIQAFRLSCLLAQPAMVVCKKEAQLYYVHIASFCKLGTDFHAQSVLINTISASKLSRKFIKVGWVATLQEEKSSWIFFFFSNSTST